MFGRLRSKKATSDPSATTSEPEKKIVIDIRDITKTYDMGELSLQVLKGVSLQVHQGEFLSIMGPSGSGKSTLMNILGALDQPTSGEYFLDGEDVSKLSESSLARVRNKKIGFVFQNFNLLRRTSAVRQVELPLIYGGGSGRTKKAKAALESVGLGQRIDHLPSELSGGQQKMVALARALMAGTRMLLLDEPFEGLAPALARRLGEVLANLKTEGVSVLIAESNEVHVLDLLARAYRIERGVVAAA